MDKFRKDPYVVIKCGADQSVFVIRPAFCGTDRQVNCKMPFLDPRKEDEVPQDEYPLCGLNSEMSPAHTESESDYTDENIVLTISPGTFKRER